MKKRFYIGGREHSTRDAFHIIKNNIIEVASLEQQYGVRDLNNGETVDQRGNVSLGGAVVRQDTHATRIMTYIKVAFGIDLDVYSNTPGSKGYFAWCGAFAVFCSKNLFMMNGIDTTQHKYLASVSRTVKTLAGSPACIKASDQLPSRGDICTVGTSEYGSHFVLFDCVVEKDKFRTYEGNGMVGGEVNAFEGVVSRVRPLDSIKYIIKQEFIK